MSDLGSASDLFGPSLPANATYAERQGYRRDILGLPGPVDRWLTANLRSTYIFGSIGRERDGINSKIMASQWWEHLHAGACIPNSNGHIIRPRDDFGMQAPAWRCSHHCEAMIL